MGSAAVPEPSPGGAGDGEARKPPVSSRVEQQQQRGFLLPAVNFSEHADEDQERQQQAGSRKRGRSKHPGVVKEPRRPSSVKGVVVSPSSAVGAVVEVIGEGDDGARQSSDKARPGHGSDDGGGGGGGDGSLGGGQGGFGADMMDTDDGDDFMALSTGSLNDSGFGVSGADEVGCAFVDLVTVFVIFYGASGFVTGDKATVKLFKRKHGKGWRSLIPTQTRLAFFNLLLIYFYFPGHFTRVI